MNNEVSDLIRNEPRLYYKFINLCRDNSFSPDEMARCIKSHLVFSMNVPETFKSALWDVISYDFDDLASEICLKAQNENKDV